MSPVMTKRPTLPKRIMTPLKTHGGKHKLANFILGNFPSEYQELDYCEVFAGGASVLLAKHPSRSETLNDLDPFTAAVWRALKESPEELSEELLKLSYSEATFRDCQLRGLTGDDIPDAVTEFTLRRMSRGGMRKAYAKSNRLRGKQMGDKNAWDNAIRKLPVVARRIQHVQVWQQDFRAVMTKFDRPDALLYLDPPYLKATRAKGSTRVYTQEMDNKDHIDLLRLCLDSRAKIILSAYKSELYEELVGHWRKTHRAVPNHASQSKQKKTKVEYLYMNY